MTEIAPRVKDIVTDALKLRKTRFDLQSSLVYDLGADSIAMAGLVVDIEKEFDITIFDEEIEKFRTVHDLIDFVERTSRN